MATILIVDDDPDMILAARLCLEGAGHRVVEAASGTEGLEQVKAEKPDVIVLDVMMDSTTEGFQTALRLRDRSEDSEYAAFRNVPILMLTAIHSTTPLRFGPDEDFLPVDEFLDKPLDPDVLLEKIDALLKK